MKKRVWIIFAIILIAFALNIYFYNSLPEKIASHWDLSGEVNGYMNKFWGVFLLPFIMVGLSIVFFLVPKIDPLKKNIKEFQNHYYNFIIILFAFLLAVNLFTLYWNLGYQININTILPIFLGILFFYVGVLCENTKRNWCIGVRTCWTLSNDIVWEKTNKLAGKLFKILGVLSIISVLFDSYYLILVFILVLIATFSLIIYSYIIFKTQKKQK